MKTICVTYPLTIRTLPLDTLRDLDPNEPFSTTPSSAPSQTTASGPALPCPALGLSAPEEIGGWGRATGDGRGGETSANTPFWGRRL